MACAITWDYVAGFFDGEGSFNCTEHVQANGHTPVRRFRLVFYQNDKEVLDEIAEFLQSRRIKCKVFLHNRPDRIAKGHSGSYMLEVNSAVNVYRCLLRMLPRLRVKRERAEIVISRLEELMALALDGELGHRANTAYAILEGVR